MHALHFDLNEWRFKLRHHGWKDEASIERHALYSNVVGHFHLTMLESQAKIKTKNFLRHIELLGQSSSDRMIDGFQGTEKELIKQFTSDTADLIDQGEWGLGLENLLTNIYEIEFTIDRRTVELAKDAIEECGMEYRDWAFVEELVK